MRRLCWLVGLIWSVAAVAVAAPAHVAPSAQNVSFAAGTTIAASLTPHGINNLIVVACGSDSTTATFTISDTTNTYTTANPRRIQTGGGALQSWFALANGTGALTITCTTSGSTGFRNILVDEFSGNDTTSPLDNHAETSNTTGAVTTTITPVANDCILWAGSNDSITAVGAGFTKGADDTASDWAEYKFLSGGAGAAQTSNFTGSGTWILVTSTFKSAGGAVATPHRLPLLGVGGLQSAFAALLSFFDL